MMSRAFGVLYVLFSALIVKGLSENLDFARDEGLLRCYFCHGMGPNNNCKMFQPYKDAVDADSAGRDHDGPVTLKTCTPPFDQSCSIETYENNNGEVAHIRDCSDDKTFDFTESRTNISTYSRLLSLRDNNETACTYDGQNTVCLSKCGRSENYTDFCNGPQFDGAPLMNLFSKYLLLSVTLFYILLFF